jgi:SSS family solute:Na+ symporter
MGMAVHRGNVFLLLFVLAGMIAFISRTSAGEAPSEDELADLREASVQILNSALREETEWVKVHAAELLVFNKYPDEARRTFEAELEKDPPTEYRIGVWRVLAKAAGNDKRIRRKYLKKIIAAFEDPAGPDREHAVETLAKLGYSDASPAVVAASGQQEGSMIAYARWVLANAGSREHEASLAELLDSENPDARGVAGYALRHLARVAPETLTKLRQAAEKENRLDDSWGRVYMLSALYVHASAEESKAQRDWAKTELLKYLQTGGKGEKNELGCALAEAGDTSDLSSVKILLKDPETDVRVYAAGAALQIARRDGRGLRADQWTGPPPAPRRWRPSLQTNSAQ